MLATKTRERQSNRGTEPIQDRSQHRADQKKRIQRLLQTEVAFIPNPRFAHAIDHFRDDNNALVAQIERGELASYATPAGGLPPHLESLCATPLLSPEDEQALFRRMNYCRFRANGLRAKLGRSPELADQVEDFLDRSTKLRNHLLQANTRLVMSIARRFADARNAFDDLLSQGLASLVHAVEKFDFERGYRFSTYATCAVRRDLYRLVMNHKRDSQRFSTGAGEHLDACQDESEPINPHAEADWNRLSGAVNSMLDELDERERFIVMRRYGLAGSDKRISYSRLGEKLGISKERVRQLANRAMEKLRGTASDRRLDLLLD